MVKVRVGVAGCGVIAQRTYLPEIKQMEKAELVAICDVVADRAQEVGTRFGVPQIYSDYEKMLAEADIDLVVDLTHIQGHFDVNLKALQAGKHVYSEKTMATTVEEATILVEEAKKRNLRLGAAAATMLSAVNRKIAQLIASGAIGKVCFAISRNGNPGPASILGGEWMTDPTWFYKPGAGPLPDLGVYGLHTVTGLLGPAKAVSAMSGISWPKRVVRTGPFKGKSIDVEVDDLTMMTLDFGNSVFAFVDSTYCLRAVRGPSLLIYGTEGVISVNEPGTASSPLSLWRDDAEHEVYGWMDVPMGNTKRHTLPAGVAHLIDCILDPSQEVITSGEHARHVIEIMNRVYVAAREGRTVQLETSF